jgi:hypothetical protein
MTTRGTKAKEDEKSFSLLIASIGVVSEGASFLFKNKTNSLLLSSSQSLWGDPVSCVARIYKYLYVER